MSEEEAYAAFVAIRFAESGGVPFCIKCPCTVVYDIKRKRVCKKTGETKIPPMFKCAECLHQFSVTSGTPLSHHKLKRVVVGARERGENGRTFVNVFRGEHEARARVRDHVDLMAVIMTDMAPGWAPLHASHKVLQVNHSERYADGDINTNQMESFFSRLGRFEAGTHHHISGPYLLNYANDAVWRENHSRVDDRRKTKAMLGSVMTAPQSRVFSGYWQHHGARQAANDTDDFFASFA